MDILDQSIDLSAIATGFNPAVASGLEVYGLFGQTLTQTLKNWASQANPFIVTGSPTIETTSGISPDSADLLTLPSSVPLSDGTGSETFLIAMNAISSAQPTVSFMAMQNLNKSNSYTTGTSIVGASSSYAGPTAQVGLLNGSTPVNGNLTIGGNNAATWAAQALPSLFALTIDMTNLLITWQVLSTGNWAGYSTTPANLAKTYAITSGYTRPTPAVQMQLGGNASSSALAASGIIHLFAKYNRVLSSTELAAFYAQAKAILAKRSIAI